MGKISWNLITSPKPENSSKNAQIFGKFGAAVIKSTKKADKQDFLKRGHFSACEKNRS